MPRPNLWTLRGADSRTTGGVCTGRIKAKQVAAGFALAATRSLSVSCHLKLVCVNLKIKPNDKQSAPHDNKTPAHPQWARGFIGVRHKSNPVDIHT